MRTSRALCLVGVSLLSGIALAQGPPHGFWTATGHDAAHDRWQKAETEISPDTVGKDFKFLWKLQLGDAHAATTSFHEPLLLPGLITGKGFKDLALWADADTLYAVDSELGQLVWKHTFPEAHAVCRGANLQIVLEPPVVIHFGVHRPSAPAKPIPEGPVPPSERRLGQSAGGGTHGLRGIYVLTGDSYIHEQILATGLDYAPPVKFLSKPVASSFALNFNNNILYTTASSGCKNTADALWSINLNNTDYVIHSYAPQKLTLAGYAGPAIASDGTAYVITGSGAEDPAAGLYPDSVLALGPDDLKVKDWYTPASAKTVLRAAPIVVPYKDKELIAAPGQGGSLVLLDSTSLGGSDHHTPLAQSEPVFKEDKHNVWESLATWQDKNGNTWVFAAISGPVDSTAKLATNGEAPHGSIVAFKVEDQGGKPVLTPAWASRDLMDPAPPAVANGVVFALDGRSASHHAMLYALDAATGKELYSSGDAIRSYTHLAGMSVGDGHVFFITHDNTLYSFGIPLEH